MPGPLKEKKTPNTAFCVVRQMSSQAVRSLLRAGTQKAEDGKHFFNVVATLSRFQKRNQTKEYLHSPSVQYKANLTYNTPLGKSKRSRERRQRSLEIERLAFETVSAILRLETILAKSSFDSDFGEQATRLLYI